MSETESNRDAPMWPEDKPLPYGVEATQMVPNVQLSANEIESRFGFHKATFEGPNVSGVDHLSLRREFKAFASYLNARLGKGRETALAMTALEEASMWSHKAIAQSDPIDPEA